jgi:hypothetical protein
MISLWDFVVEHVCDGLALLVLLLIIRKTVKGGRHVLPPMCDVWPAMPPFDPEAQFAPPRSYFEQDEQTPPPNPG